MTTPTPTTLDRIIQNLTRIIPRPFKPAPKAQLSWHQLKVGQWLESQVGYFKAGVGNLPAHTIYQVTRVNSDGAQLTTYTDCVTHLEELTTLNWQDPDWKQSFKRLRQPKIRIGENKS